MDEKQRGAARHDRAAESINENESSTLPVRAVYVCECADRGPLRCIYCVRILLVCCRDCGRPILDCRGCEKWRVNPFSRGGDA